MQPILFVTFTAPGWHCWPSAPEHRAYLAFSHRHLFHVKVRLEVSHEEREIEFHDLLEFAKTSFGEGDFGAASCETLARKLAQQVAETFDRPWVEVTVSEDGEAGATVTLCL